MTVAIPDHAVHEPIAAPRSSGGNAATITRQRARRQERAERALQRAAGDQHLDARRDRAQQRDDAEAGDADREHAPLAEHVAERAADEDQRPEREQVGVRHPLLAGEPAAEVGADGRQRDVDGGGVEAGDERAHDRRDQCEPLAGDLTEHDEAVKPSRRHHAMPAAAAGSTSS